MNHISKFNEHVYNKATKVSGKKWMENFGSLLKYLTNQIGNRQVTDFSKSGDKIDFQINKRKYRIDKGEKKICLYDKHKGQVEEVCLELKDDQLTQILDAFKKPLKSPKAEEQGRKPYLTESVMVDNPCATISETLFFNRTLFDLTEQSGCDKMAKTICEELGLDNY